jgi:uncharacterized protein (TIGR02246 family)
MRKSLSVLAAVLAAELALGLGRGDAQTTPSADEQSIRQAVANYAAALTKADLATIAAYWTPDAQYTDENGATHKGRDAIVALFRKGLEAAKGTKYQLRTTSLRFIRPDVALQDGQSDATAADGSTDRSKFTAVWVKTGGRWQVSSAHDLPDEPATPADAAHALKGLEWLAGEWVSEDKTAPVTMTCKPTLNKSFFVQEFTLPEKSGGTTVLQWFGFDPAAESLRSWVFDSKGGTAGGLWDRDGHTWVGEMAGVLPDGRTGTTRLRMKFINDNTFLWESTDRVIDEQPVPDSSVKYVRKTPKQ